MDVKKFIGMCAERYREVIIRNRYGSIVAKGVVRDIIFDNEFSWSVIKDTSLILVANVDCFYFSNEKLNITLK